MIENICLHFQERHQDVVRWPWKLFCAKWVRVLEVIRQQQREKHQSEVEHSFRDLAARHKEQWGENGSSGDGR